MVKMSIRRPGVATQICVPRFRSPICSATPAPPYTAVDLDTARKAKKCQRDIVSRGQRKSTREIKQQILVIKNFALAPISARFPYNFKCSYLLESQLLSKSLANQMNLISELTCWGKHETNGTGFIRSQRGLIHNVP